VAERPGRARAGRPRGEGVWYPRWFWPLFSFPGIAWLAVLFLVPFYVVLSVAFGTIDPIFRNPVPIWNPAQWYTGTFGHVLDRIFGPGAFLGPPFVRTFVYVAAASLLCLLISYPVAYYVARYAGRRKGLLLVMLIAPFWISYMMRMLAWVNLLEGDGLVNRTLTTLHLVGRPVDWLGGNQLTVILGLVYGYIPYMILPLFAGLDRIDLSLLEASRDLGASRLRTFVRVTLPMSKQAILAGMVIVSLPMFGDYFTNTLLSGSPRTTMIGNLIDDSVGTPGQGTNAAVLVLILMIILIIPMLYYVYSTSKATRERAA
jgi:ABC-type spermidine/putrescine transport system permease subunit I